MDISPHIFQIAVREAPRRLFRHRVYPRPV